MTLEITSPVNNCHLLTHSDYWLQPSHLRGGRRHTSSKVYRRRHRGCRVRPKLRHSVRAHRQVSAALSALDAVIHIIIMLGINIA